MIEEQYLKENIGRKNCFVVPEGYFEQMKSQVMEQLPERKARMTVLRPWVYAAACTIAAILLGVTYSNHHQSYEEPVSDNNSYIEEAADYAMIDNTDIYACLSEE